MLLKYTPIQPLIIVFALLCGAQSVYAAKTTQHDISSTIFEDRRWIPDGGDFTLMAPSGLTSLSHFKDKVVILLFGYLSCPDICPLSLKKVATTLKNLTPQDRKSVQVIFITLDPERDSLENLSKFVTYFDESILAMRGSSEEIRHITNMYGVEYFKVKSATGTGYVFNHSVASYILGPDNLIRYILPNESTAADMVDVIHNLFKKHSLIHK